MRRQVVTSRYPIEGMLRMTGDSARFREMRWVVEHSVGKFWTPSDHYPLLLELGL